MSTPIVTIFVRHAAGCKYAGDEFAKRCNCGKHLRWTHDRKQTRRSAGTRSWAEAETKKRDIEDQLSGRVIAPMDSGGKDLQTCIKVFVQDKRVQGITEDVLKKYDRELFRLRDYAERHKAYTVRGLTRELLTGYAATWGKIYPSTQTRSSVRARLRSFLRYCYEAQWLPRIPAVPKITVDEPPTLPLTPEEYDRLLACSTPKVRALFQLMRWSGLAIRDSLTLRRSALVRTDRGHYLIKTVRQKTGTDVMVPVPKAVGEDILDGYTAGDYIFWDGESDIVKHWTKYLIAPAFKAAEIHSEGNMVSHRLRDTFAVDLLQKGVPMEEVSKLLGHTSIKTTERHYSSWMQSRQDRLESLVTGTWS